MLLRMEEGVSMQLISRLQSQALVMELEELHLLRLILDGKELGIMLRVLFRNLVDLKIRMLKMLHFKLRELELSKLNIQLER